MRNRANVKSCRQSGSQTCSEMGSLLCCACGAPRRKNVRSEGRWGRGVAHDRSDESERSEAEQCSQRNEEPSEGNSGGSSVWSEPIETEPLVIEERSPGVRSVVSSHELRHQQSEVGQFSRWKKDKEEQREREILAVRREAESMELSEKETEQHIWQHRRRQSAEAQLRAYERYVRNSYGVVEVTTSKPDGRRESIEVRIPKTHDHIAERVVKFSLST